MLIVYTGNGKGKTTASLGVAFRSLGYGWKVCFVQFMKGTWKTGEQESVKLVSDRMELVRGGKGFYKILDDHFTEADHKKSAAETWQIASEKILSGDYKLVVLDEIIVAMDLQLLNATAVIDFLKTAKEKCHIIVSGRGASAALLDIADLTTEMREIKHPFQKGLPPVQGIDF